MSEVQPQTRDRIFRTALRLFAERGHANVSMREVAEEAGISKPMLYYYFDSKNGLIKALFDDAMGSLESKMARISSEPVDATEKLRRLASVLLDKRRDTRDGRQFFVTLVSDPVIVHEVLKKSLMERLPLLRRRIIDLIAEGQAQRTFRGDFDPELACNVMLGTVQMYLGLNAHGGDTELAPRLADELMDLLVKGFGAGGANASPRPAQDNNGGIGENASHR